MYRRNPYYAYVELNIGNLSVNNIDNGTISLQANYKDKAYCTFIIEVYDATAHTVADAIIANGRDITVTYGYSDSDQRIDGLKCMITNIHTELVGTGETLTLELLPEYLDTVLLSVQEFHTSDKKYEGTPSEVLKQLIQDVGWREGRIVDTKELKGENNGNDYLNDDRKDYYYWQSDVPITEFMEELRRCAITPDDRGNFILNVDYTTDVPTVYFYPSSDPPPSSHYLEWVYGREESDIISLTVDWGDALLSYVGYTGSNNEGQDDTTNQTYETGTQVGYKSEVKPIGPANWDVEVETLPDGTTKVLSQQEVEDRKRKGVVYTDTGKETFYNTLDPSSPAFGWAINANPGSGMATWNIYYRADGVLMWGDYVVVAADISGNYKGEPGYPELVNHQGRFERGQIVETTLGPGIVVDGCRAACDYDGDQFDIAVNWGK